MTQALLKQAGLAATVALICLAHIVQAQQISKRAGGNSLNPYSPKSVASLEQLPPRIGKTLVTHLVARLGDEFYSRLTFRNGDVVNFDDLYRVYPEARHYQWKVFA